MEMLVALICGILLGILSINFGRLVGMAIEMCGVLTSIDLHLMDIRDVLRDNLVEQSRFNDSMVDYLLQDSELVPDPSGPDQEKDDLDGLSFADMLSDLPDWPVEDTREENLDDEA